MLSDLVAGGIRPLPVASNGAQWVVGCWSVNLVEFLEIRIENIGGLPGGLSG